MSKFIINTDNLTVVPFDDANDLPERIRQELKDELRDEIKEEIMNDIQSGIDEFIDQLILNAEDTLEEVRSLQDTMDNGFDISNFV